MLQDFLRANRDTIVARARAKVIERASPRATEEELRFGVPLFMDQFIEALGEAYVARAASDAIGDYAAIHGGELMRMGFTVAQVVYDYGDICQAVTALADEMDESITAAEYHALNRYLDDAIARAVTEHARRRDRMIAGRGTEHLGALAKAMRGQLAATMLSLDLLRKGTVGVGGSTAAALGNGLSALRHLVDGSFARSRLESGARQPERIAIAELLQHLADDAAFDGRGRGVQVRVEFPETELHVWADRELLEVGAAKLVQNAVAFTLLGGRASLKATAMGERVLVEIHDECGGLSADTASFLALSLEAGDLRVAGTGAGLSVARDCIDAVGGVVRVRDVAGTGCVISIDLQGLPAASA